MINLFVEQIRVRDTVLALTVISPTPSDFLPDPGACQSEYLISALCDGGGEVNAKRKRLRDNQKRNRRK